MKDGCCKPAQGELDISFSCFDVLQISDVNGFPPVPRQRDPKQACGE